jgi:thiamine kinase-like enzyme
MLAHNDLHFGNILVDKERAYIIDWEEFYISNAPFELAATIYRVVADESLKDSLMQKFYNRVPTKIDHAKFRIGSIIYLFMQAVKDLSTLDEKDRFGITYNEYKALPEPTIHLKKVLDKNEEITLETKKVYFWSMMKKVDSLVSERGFKDDFKLINKSEKREPKAFKRTVLERFKES